MAIIQLHVVLGPWDEDILTALNAPPLGPVFATVPLTMAANDERFVSVDITTQVNDWLSGATPNNGIAFLPGLGVGTTDIRVDLDSQENRNAGHPPELEIWVFGGPPGQRDQQEQPGQPD